MRLGKLGEQIVLKSEKAFTKIKFIGSEEAKASDYYQKKTERDKEARREYRLSKSTTDSINDLYMIDIIREGIENGDPRLR